MSIYTIGVWTVKPGREDDFVAGWRALAQWTLDEDLGGTHATLVRDHENPRRFVSFGPWGSVEAIERWRAHPGFGRHFAALQETIESFEPGMYESVLVIS